MIAKLSLVGLFRASVINLSGLKVHFPGLFLSARYASGAAGYKIASNLKDCYQLLNIPEDCDSSQLKGAYIRLAKHYHPDSKSTTADAKKFAQVQEAYRTISARLSENGKDSDEDDVEKAIEKNFDIKHTAPQHRQYLEYDGIGYGTPSQRQRQYQQHRASKASEHTFEYRVRKLADKYEQSMVVKNKEAVRQVKSTSAIHRLVEDMIRDSMEKGEFDNLSGKGKPLTRTDYNPLVDTTTHNINKILINNGYAPEWITLNSEVRKHIVKVRENIHKERQKFGKEPFSYYDQKRWQKVIADFDMAVRDLNKNIDKLNMIVPTIRQQLPHMSAAREIRRVKENYVHTDPMDDKGLNPIEESQGKSEKSRGLLGEILSKIGQKLTIKVFRDGNTDTQ
ncbi:dnaJ homolog subfamily C member 28-like [Glandiceps talaboti]